MRLTRVALAAALTARLALADELDDDLARKKEALAAVSGDIEGALGPDFNVSREVQFKLKTSVVQTWASGVSTPNFTLNAVGIGAEGDLVYKPRWYKLWLKNPDNEKVRLTFLPFGVVSVPGRVSLLSSLSGHAEARIFIHAGGIESNVFCQTNPDVQASVRADFQVDTPVAAVLPYRLLLTEPSSLKIPVTCYLGGLGNYSVIFPVDNLAKELSRGDFDLGYKDTLTIELPTNPATTIKVKLEAKNQQAAIDADALGIGADIEVLK